jgi:hypothetical protein
LEEAPLLVFALFSDVKAGNGTMVTHDAGPDFTRLAFSVGQNNGGGRDSFLGFGGDHDFDFV